MKFFFWKLFFTLITDLYFYLLIRLTLRSKSDKELFEAFTKIKEYLGQKQYTEVTRFCILRTYELLKNKELIKDKD